MGARFAYLAVGLAALAWIAGCAFNPYSEPRAAWRDDVEATCLARGEVQPSAFVQPMAPLGGRGSCGLEHPFGVSGALGGKVSVEPAATLDCSMTGAINRWLAGPVQLAAFTHFREPVVAIRQLASYGCRTRDNIPGAKLSEHAFGNALDVAAFRLADGREISVLQGWWRGNPNDRDFLKEVFAGACAEFYTVLGPGSDSYHANHFHLDLLVTNARDGRHYCQPNPGSSFDGVPTASLPEASSEGRAAPLLSFRGR
jgi:hypothetical protein